MLKLSKINVFVGLMVLSFSIAPISLADNNPNLIVQDAIRFYFSDVPIMIDIARCETGFRQYNPDGSALHDASGTYVGVFQISEHIHTPRAQSMGLDVRTLDGNLLYARYLYDTSGTGPWKGCLPKTTPPEIPTQVPTPAPTPTPIPVTPVPVTSGSFTANLRMGMSNSQILLLQQVLNRNGYVIAQTGPGSVGNETNYFGSLTREALRRFQCAKQIACDGNEATTGYGRVGPNTRAALNQL